MAIKNYGLDAAEIEHLKAANLTDDEINKLNKKRITEQLDEDSDEVIDHVADLSEEEFHKELARVNKEIDPADYPEGYTKEQVKQINIMTLNELRELLLMDGSSTYDENGNWIGPSAAYGRYMKLKELQKQLQAEGKSAPNDSIEWIPGIGRK